MFFSHYIATVAQTNELWCRVLESLELIYFLLYFISYIIQGGEEASEEEGEGEGGEEEGETADTAGKDEL